MDSQGISLTQIVILIGLVVAFIYFTRAVFSISKLLKYLRANMRINAIIAERLGANKDNVKSILADAEELTAFERLTKTEDPKILLILLFPLLLFTNCTKYPKTTPSGTTSSITLSGHQGLIPWWVVDTISAILDTPQAGRYFDTMYCYVNNDTSMLSFNGSNYYVWFEDNSGLSPYSDSEQTLLSCYIGHTLYDTVNYLTTCQVFPSKYWDNSKMDWQTQKQSLWVNQIYKVDKHLSNGLFIY